MKHHIAVVVSNSNEKATAFDTIDAIKKAGFKNVFIQWYNENWRPSQAEQLKRIQACGLGVIFAHLGYQNINNIWLDHEAGRELVARYKEDIRICHQNKIPMVVMHLTAGNKAPKYNELGIDRLKEIVAYADKLDMKIAFENTRIKGYLDYVIEQINCHNVGICFDSGHYHTHFHDEFDFDKYKNRIFAVHLHDNDQTGDLHFLPFDGTLNWDTVMQRLKQCNYSGPVTIEPCYRYGYLKMDLDHFYEKAYQAAVRLEQMMRSET